MFHSQDLLKPEECTNATGASMSFNRTIIDDIVVGVLWYVISLIPVVLGIYFGTEHIVGNGGPNHPRPGILTACSRFDGNHYREITDRGYRYNPSKRSTVAFFPVYPLMGSAVAFVTGWDARIALLVVSNFMLVCSFSAFSAYLRVRFPTIPSTTGSLIVGLLALWPAGLFFRMVYSESTFLFFTLIFLCGCTRRWPLPVLALLAGSVTAVRPVGLAATAAFVWYVLSDLSRGSAVRRSLIAFAYCPLACWGLLAYMAYQYDCFGTPLAFAQTQEHWTYAAPVENDIWEKAESLLAGEPIWGCYHHDSLRRWNRLDSSDNVLFNLAFWNPILFVGAFILIVYGAVRAWLSGEEVVLGLVLLIIPYLTRAYEMSMASHGRFAAVVLPAYIVLARLLTWQDWGMRAAFVICSCILMIWCALFAAAYPFF